ncbi:ArsR/SmtB family transcription factor [Saccharothrix sp. ST-888]|uniref:ArsR/SmtB family transcription factor n=1 Tax=Saccharothrix sp. ST-888 TaxID=1427391 RepID=UPI0005EC0A05|nr:helix-turn-helix domain-containing protein [Saccharothrix sp. ST-888]
MVRSQQRRTPLHHPDVEEIDLLDVLHALADPTRMTIVQTLWAEPERACGTFPVDVAPSTLSHHFKVLRESGVIRQRGEANRRLNELRRDELQARFPGVLDAILAAAGPIEPGPVEPDPVKAG